MGFKGSYCKMYRHRFGLREQIILRFLTPKDGTFCKDEFVYHEKDRKYVFSGM